MQDQSDFVCPLCEGEEVQDLGNRVREQCTKCNSKARSRAAFLALRCAGAFDSGSARILLLSPDRPLAKAASSRTTGLDVRAPEPSRSKFSFTEVKPFDLASVHPGEQFDYVVHSHFIDATPIDFADAITIIDGLVVPGGWHLFSVPVKGSILDELDPGSSAAQRSAKFGSEGRYRTFGSDDLVPMLSELWGVEDVIFPLRRRYSKRDLYRHGLNLRHLERPHSNTIFGRQVTA